MTWLSDDAVARLRAVTDEPETTGTRYRIIRQLGRGGMGVVYEAEDRELERRVAFKVLASEATIGAERLRDEARIIARLEHPGIVPLHDAGVLPDGRVFYVMKLVRGRRASTSSRASRMRRPSCCASSCASARRSRSRTRAASCTAISSRRTSCWASSARCW